MLKTWQRVCNLPLKSFVLELLSIDFLTTYQYATNSSMYYDWMVRDFLAWLLAKSAWHGVYVPGTYEYVSIGDAWRSRAQSASERAQQACYYEANSMPYNAGGEWQNIFGDDIPVG